MVKKSKPSVKVESKASVEEETRELNIQYTGGGIIDFVLFYNVLGGLIGIIYIIVGLLRYVFRTL
jgi:hypothetical protein